VLTMSVSWWLAECASLLQLKQRLHDNGCVSITSLGAACGQQAPTAPGQCAAAYAIRYAALY
jgi:hypothetical protein